MREPDAMLRSQIEVRDGDSHDGRSRGKLQLARPWDIILGHSRRPRDVITMLNPVLFGILLCLLLVTLAALGSSGTSQGAKR